MFGKLFKHEFLATWRTLATVAGVIYLVSCTLLLPVVFNVPLFGSGALVLALIGFASLTAVVPILLAIHYWRTMYGGPGYLTHSLPVRGGVIYAAKVTYAALTTLVASVVGLGSAFALPVLAFRIHSAGFVDEVWTGLKTQLGTIPLAPMLAALLAYYAVEYVIYLSAITIGTRGALGRLGAGGVVIALVATYFLLQLTAAIALFVIPLGLRITGPHIGSVAWEFMGLDVFSGTQPTVIGIGWLPVVVIIAIVAVVIAIRSVERHTSLV
ncbi:MAG: hypothetical protein LBI33_13230 [Propionibacteriaceae bacterium]|jgi:hypothetical protein|nr:hypothetical protein [Propionibacteriaceae bacterium]